MALFDLNSEDIPLAVSLSEQLSNKKLKRLTKRGLFMVEKKEEFNDFHSEGLKGTLPGVTASCPLTLLVGASGESLVTKISKPWPAT